MRLQQDSTAAALSAAVSLLVAVAALGSIGSGGGAAAARAERVRLGADAVELTSARSTATHHPAWGAVTGQHPAWGASAAEPADADAQHPARGADPAEPSEASPEDGAAAEPSAPAPAEAGSAGPEWVWPADGEVTSEFGRRWGRLHKGLDISAGHGAAVVAARDGEVTTARSMGGYGLIVEVAHADGLATAYAHLSSVSVAAGQAVAAGDRLGAMGCTGSCTGTHLHFEVRRADAATDPRQVLP